MSPDQFRRANSTSFSVCLVILLSGLILTIINTFQTGLTAGKIAIFINVILGGIMICLGQFKFPTLKLGCILIMGGSTLFYFVLLIAEDSISYFAFGLPILFCSIVYLNVRLCKCGVAAITVSFFITCMKAFLTTGYLDMVHVPAFITLALAFFFERTLLYRKCLLVQYE